MNKSLTELLEDLKSSDYRLRANTTFKLAKLDNAHVSQLLISVMFEDEASAVRSCAAAAIADRAEVVAEDIDYVEPLIRMANDPDSSVRSSVAESLGRIGDARAVESLIKMLNDPSPLVIFMAAYSLGLLRDIRAIDPLIEHLRDETLIPHPSADPRPTVREIVEDALVMIGEPAVEPLRQALASPNEAIRTGAAQALRRLGSKP